MANVGGKRPGAGRPKGSLEALGVDGRIAARQHAEKAMKVLVDLLTSPMHTVRVSAANSILDRAYGRPAQAVEVTGKDGGAIQHEEVKNDAERFTSTILGLVARAAEDEVPRGTEH